MGNMQTSINKICANRVVQLAQDLADKKITPRTFQMVVSKYGRIYRANWRK